jgi:hypothetical protein
MDALTDDVREHADVDQIGSDDERRGRSTSLGRGRNEQALVGGRDNETNDEDTTDAEVPASFSTLTQMGTLLPLTRKRGYARML